MKLKSYFLALLVFLALNLEASSLLYKVISPSSTVYILGSIHLAKPELYPLPKAITSAYEESETLVLELDPSSAESMATIQKTMMISGIYPPGKSLSTQLKPRTYKELKTYMSKINMDLGAMEQMRPWVVMLQLSIMEMMRLGYSPELGIDQHFLNMAKADHKPVIELETAAQQMALLSKDDKNFQDNLLYYTLKDMHELEPMLDEMFISWKNGDAEAFDKMMSKSIKDDPSLIEIYDEIITKRNFSMTKRIKGFLKSTKTYFVVVGSGHVVGDEGIVSLLRKSGYTVIQY